MRSLQVRWNNRAAALAFGFDVDETSFPRDIKPDSKVTSIWLTYPNIMDDDF